MPIQYRKDAVSKLAACLSKEVYSFGIGQKKLAELVGVSASTFSDLICCNSERPRSLKKLAAFDGWLPETRDAIEALLNYDHRRIAAVLQSRSKYRLQHDQAVARQ